MKRPFKIIPLVIAFLLHLPTLSLAAQFKVIQVYDGDTIRAKSHDIYIKVRLVGIDAPETSKKKDQTQQPYSRRSKKYLTELILNKTVGIKFYGLDKYDWIWGVLFLEGKNINFEMVHMGMAEAYRGKQQKGFNPFPYLSAEEEARAVVRGMWRLGNEYISPKEWRKMYGE